MEADKAITKRGAVTGGKVTKKFLGKSVVGVGGEGGDNWLKDGVVGIGLGPIQMNGVVGLDEA